MAPDQGHSNPRQTGQLSTGQFSRENSLWRPPYPAPSQARCSRLQQRVTKHWVRDHPRIIGCYLDTKLTLYSLYMTLHWRGGVGCQRQCLVPPMIMTGNVMSEQKQGIKTRIKLAAGDKSDDVTMGISCVMFLSRVRIENTASGGWIPGQRFHLW